MEVELHVGAPDLITLGTFESRNESNGVSLESPKR